MPQYGLNYDTAFLESLPIVQGTSSFLSPVIVSPEPQQLFHFTETMGSSKSTTASHPIRTLSASQFESLHHQHVLSHSPDSVLFPFLHGIEGDNEAQNLFFATQGQQAIVCGPKRADDKPKQRRTSVQVPKYRGLMWVICEDDLENPEKDLRVLVHRTSDLSSSSSLDPYDEDSSESYFDEDDELDDDEDDTSSESFGDPISPSTSPYSKEPLVRPVSPSQMDVDIAYTDDGDDPQDPMHGVVEIVGVGADEKHMHPVQHRLGNGHALPKPIRTSNLPSSYHEATPSASTSMTSEFSTSETDDSIDVDTSHATELTDYTDQDQRATGRERSASSPPTLLPATEAQFTPPPPHSPRSHHHKHASTSSRRIAPPILTSTFRVCDLLRRVPKYGSGAESNTVDEELRDGAGYVVGGANAAPELQHDRLVPSGNSSADDDGEWEFVPLHVPEGISLRNFGIQVPILVTISDIVVYSPTPLGASKSPNAMRLAKRFQQAIDRKRKERVGCEESVPLAPNHSPSVPSSPDLHDAEKDATADDDTPLSYNVFLLDANADEIRREMPHLVVRLCPEGEVPGSLGAAMTDFNSCLKYTEQKTLSPTSDERDGDIIMSDGLNGSSSFPSASSLPLSSPPPIVPSQSPNTVDFAQRERDEMRDLTRASEIVSVFPEGHPLAHLNPNPLHPPVQVLPHSHHVPIHSPSLGDEDEDEIDLTSTRTFWDPRVGQIFLGNANDVPLPVDGVGEFGERDERWAGQDSCERGVYPPGNSPVYGYGYDICIECHDFAPFPSGVHLKAAEEKVDMLEQRWKDIVEQNQRENREKGQGEQSNAADADSVLPARPPPHPNSIIHLPMPSSPPSTTATMTALMPVVKFLQKCLMPTEPIKSAPQPEPVPAPMSRTMEMALGMHESGGDNAGSQSSGENKSRRWSSVSSLIPSFPSFPLHSSSVSNPPPPPPPPASSPSSRLRSFTSPAQAPSPAPQNSIVSPSPSSNAAYSWSRPLKILLYSSDGYTESSVPALCLLMAIKGLSLPQAYLELQVAKRRSFFVYQIDLGVLRRVESLSMEERREERQKEERQRRARMSVNGHGHGNGHVDVSNSLFGSGSFGSGIATHMNPYAAAGTWGGGVSSGSRNDHPSMVPTDSMSQQVHNNRAAHGHGHGHGRPSAKSVSFAQSPIAIPHENGNVNGSGHQRASSEAPQESDLGAQERHFGLMMGGTKSSTLPISSSVPSLLSSSTGFAGVGGSVGAATGGALMGKTPRRPRASTSPWLPSLFGGDHQSWFNDPRFDGSFPSRVLPFLYLGNLAHASNVYMLQALGITHVVSVGECALIPPSNMHLNNPPHLPGRQYGSNAHYVPGKSPNHQGSLWIEERAGRIKVLDIQGVCDDGIDTLEPQLEPICEWIDQARQEGGQVLVHCRVGVSRSATVTIAYVMKHLSLPLVDAYLIVRSRRLSVLIQPNMRLLYNLLGWEIKLAKERAGGDEKKLKNELSSALSWPYLAKEVHALNEKYLMH